MFRMFQRTRLTAVAASALLLFGAAACGSGESDDAAAPADNAQKGAYPVTLDHKYGDTTLESEPQRIVTVGLSDQDAVLALGKVPVGTTEWLGEFKGAVGPWAEKALGDKPRPTVLHDDGTGPQVEKIASLRPDLILALYSGLTKDQYRTLSKIAPVVAQPEDGPDWSISWQDQTAQVGKALGKNEEAAALVAKTEKHITDAAAAHPEFKGKSAVMATPYQGMYVYGPQDNRSRLLNGLGFRLPTDLSTVVGDAFGANISKERTDLLDTDAVVWIVTDPAKDTNKLHADPLYGKLGVAEEGREVMVKESSHFGSAISFVSPLSLPYTVDRLVPMLAAAVDGKTDTKVEQPAS
ncbi:MULTISPECIES: iron-siderophore ABC transporter substrate-binding protein [Streptomyces]|uniref:iron-siderophore ABC transporter substrate-binding protein n=1 Tax=Streptomyces TaxID=1883 RepID=UPI002060C1FE|nr:MULTISPECIES: iron-siderophore ABC transporter substrate-binding protein [Streptomyces]UPT45454.1 iron-siderophore ABC transporter substrate-binding protein [Streptomyces sp. WAC00303]WIY79587.1 iron-siderophore ABC transporter substrate-binding protein [Streptomyces anulatus]